MKRQPDNLSDTMREQITDNERNANRAVALFSLIFVAISIAACFIWRVNYSEALYLLNTYVFLPLSTLSVAGYIIARRHDFSAPWIKYMLLLNVMLVSVGIFFVFTTYLSYFIFLPVCLATRYFNRRLTHRVAIATLVLFLIACALNLALEPVSEPMQMLHSDLAYNSWQSTLDAVTFIIIPMSLTFLFFAMFTVNQTSDCYKMMAEHAQYAGRVATAEAELNMASQIQRSVLPEKSFVTENGNFRVSACELTAKEVGGDFYDYFMIGENKMAVLIADVSDKGAAAAMFMMSAKKVLRCAVFCSETLEQAIILANKLICQDNKSEMFITLWMGIIDIRSGTGKYINAGHLPPPVRHADGSVTEIENEPDLFLGYFPDENPTVHTFRMKKGETLLLYTDGVTDALNGAGEAYGRERLNTAFKEIPAGEDGIADIIVQDVTRFSGGADLFDDMTVLALHCAALEPPKKANFDVAAGTKGTKRVLDGINDILRGTDCPEEKRQNVCVVADEICANISDYAYEEGTGPMLVEAWAGGSFISLRFTDFGIAYNPLECPDPEFSSEPMIGGLGLYLVRNLVDTMEYRRKDDKNILTVKLIWSM